MSSERFAAHFLVLTFWGGSYMIMIRPFELKKGKRE